MAAALSMHVLILNSNSQSLSCQNQLKNKLTLFPLKLIAELLADFSECWLGPNLSILHPTNKSPDSDLV